MYLKSGSWVLLFLALPTIAIMNIENYRIVDGSNNQYLVSRTTVEYLPIKKENSSSGVYSGGNAWKKPISEKQYQLIQKLFESAANEKSQLRKKRSMGTYLLQSGPMGDRKSVIIDG